MWLIVFLVTAPIAATVTFCCLCGINRRCPQPPRDELADRRARRAAA